jgi:EAL domain-containing protein (putative c-di-GMP-specific phosphodiesterase class I)/GGDEF domain-containing protein/ActR/RegA family two-component response regulator
VAWQLRGGADRRRADSEATEVGSTEETVLVVAEDFATRQSLIAVLAASDVEAFGASPSEAVATQTLYHPAAAVVEHLATGTDGVALASRLKERDPDMPVLLLTDPVSLSSAQGGGVVDSYLVKPLASAAFVQTVRSAFAQRSLSLANRQLVSRLEGRDLQVDTGEPRYEESPYEGPQVAGAEFAAAQFAPPPPPAADYAMPQPVAQFGEAQFEGHVAGQAQYAEPAKLPNILTPIRSEPPWPDEPGTFGQPAGGGFPPPPPSMQATPPAASFAPMPEAAPVPHVADRAPAVPTYEAAPPSPPMQAAAPPPPMQTAPTAPAAQAYPAAPAPEPAPRTAFEEQPEVVHAYEIPIAEPFPSSVAAESHALPNEIRLSDPTPSPSPSSYADPSPSPSPSSDVTSDFPNPFGETRLARSLSLDDESPQALDRVVYDALASMRVPRPAALIVLEVDIAPDAYANADAHREGILQHVSGQLSSSRRRTDTVSWLGDNRFAVVCADVDSPETAGTLASSIIRELSRPMAVAGSELRIGVTAGVVLVDAEEDEGRTPESLFEDATLALRMARDEERPWALFDEGVGDGIRIRERLRRAMEKGELRLDYQKVVNLQNQEVVGAEALLRWTRGGRPVPAAEFLDKARESGAVVPLGRWVLERAISELANWRARGDLAERFRLFVNVSPEEVVDPGFSEMVEKLLRDHGVPPTMLSLEMPETGLGEAAEDSNAVEGLRLLGGLGVAFVVDDFGTGRSNLDWLQELPVSGLKINPELIGLLDRADDRRGPALVRGMIALGHELKIKVVGEGVESASQAVALRAMGCDLAQGFYMGRPEPSEQLALALAG